MTHVLRLGPYRQGFFDPITRIYLTKAVPQGEIPAGNPLPSAILTALSSGDLIDVNDTTNFRNKNKSTPSPEDTMVELQPSAEVESEINIDIRSDETKSKKGKK